MKTIIVSFGVLALLVLPAAGQDKEEERVANAGTVISEIMSFALTSLPYSFLLASLSGRRVDPASKRGNVYLRRMLIHGARAVLLRVKYDTGRFGQWVHRLAQRAPRNKVIVAIANKLARIAWAVLSSGKDYQHQSLQMTAA
jgi:hypothetical protein